MPINYSVKPTIKKHIRKKSTETVFDIDVMSIDVELIHSPKYEDLEGFIPQFTTATWCDNPGEGVVYESLKDEMMDYFLDEKVLPTAYEVVYLLFKVTGIEHTTASHLIRHRTLSFSARTHADRDNRDSRYTIPGSIYDSEFCEEYKSICRQAVNLYAKMIDSNKISTMDARAILPRSEQTYYFVGGNLGAILRFIRIRLDVQTQPQTDNILAMLMWKEIVKRYPKMRNKINFEQQDKFYINAANTNVGHNLFAPAKKNDVFDWHPDSFIYSKHRDEFIGAQYYLNRKQEILKEINEMEDK